MASLTQHLFLWTLDGEYNLLSAHIQTGKDQALSELEPLKEKIHSELKKQFHIDHITLEFEPIDKEVLSDKI